MQNPLSSNNLLGTLKNCLSQSKTRLKSQCDALALLFHAAFLNLGFQFLGNSESENAPIDPNNSDIRLLPETWNNNQETFTFRYKHPQSAMTFLLKCLKLSDKFIVHGYAIQDGKINTLELKLSECVRDDISRLENPEVSLFPCLYDLMIKLKEQILQKLIPGLHKEGYEESSSTAASSTNQSQARQNYPPPPSYIPPARPYFMEPNYGVPTMPNPYGIGSNDLDPMGPFRAPSAGGGMYVGPNHPMFTDPAFPPNPALPFGAVPPGARFDPISPIDPLTGRPARPNLRPRGPFSSGEPDPDLFPPPGGPGYFM
ncbi:Proteasome Inhibitor PI31 domain-containing protein [Rozella allomycis CSF55]|uniref:Proteasome Inhibitor PI31 domain-containing protein n=1 Tax=Rozella allomycis (strain CSF55) TaxID=988480 RepID=A0A075AY58_ROZAC|nr:Proteasome Inhibitor PI31 domain-containing protein [Rozella allomycis CSF55]|eukprot:EPZ35255.1 Proteasome Inhibitor PI31 domain-containing protein [Rozella allomycis CSF55]